MKLLIFSLTLFTVASTICMNGNQAASNITVNDDLSWITPENAKANLLSAAYLTAREHPDPEEKWIRVDRLIAILNRLITDPIERQRFDQYCVLIAHDSEMRTLKSLGLN